MKIIEAYHCDYCKKYSKSKGVITRHEKECYHNPVTMACATCKHLYQDLYRKPHTLPDGTEISCGLARPMCAEGREISTLSNDNIKGHTVNLANHCPLWQLREEHEEE